MGAGASSSPSKASVHYNAAAFQGASMQPFPSHLLTQGYCEQEDAHLAYAMKAGLLGRHPSIRNPVECETEGLIDLSLEQLIERVTEIFDNDAENLGTLVKLLEAMAEPERVDAVKARIATLTDRPDDGPSHCSRKGVSSIKNARALDRLAAHLCKLGNWAGAHALYGLSLNIRETHLGERHPLTEATRAGMNRAASNLVSSGG